MTLGRRRAPRSPRPSEGARRMTQESFDDGLVHGHEWAKEPPMPCGAPPSRPPAPHDPALAAAMARKQEPAG